MKNNEVPRREVVAAKLSILNIEYRPYLVSTLVGEVQLRLLGAEVDPRPLGHHLQVNSFVRLHSHHQLIPLTALLGKYVSRNVGELQTHLCFPLIQSFTTAEDERNSCSMSDCRDNRHELR